MGRFGDDYDVRLVEGVQKLNGQPQDYIVDQDEMSATITDCEDHLLLARRAFAAGQASCGEVTSERAPSNVTELPLSHVPHAPGYAPYAKSRRAGK